MIDPFFKYFSSGRNIPSRLFYGAADAPPKSYNRFLQITLPAPLSLPVSLEKVLHDRFSPQRFISRPLSAEHLGTILGRAVGNIHDSFLQSGERRRPHPSGGATYPIEVYPFIVAQRGDIVPGLYHYNPASHALELLPADAPERVSMYFAHHTDIAESAGALFILSFLKSRSMHKYGSFSYKLGLIEGGHIGQNIYLIATALGLGCRALGGGDVEKLNDALRLDGVNETVFYTLAVGEFE